MRQSYASYCCDLCKSAKPNAVSAYFTSKQILPLQSSIVVCSVYRDLLCPWSRWSTCVWRLFVCRDHKDHTEQTALHHIRPNCHKETVCNPRKTRQGHTIPANTTHLSEYPMFDQWWANVIDGGPTLVKHWVDVSRLLTTHIPNVWPMLGQRRRRWATHMPNVWPMLGQRRRRWANIGQTLGKCVVFADDTSTQCLTNVGPTS